MGVGLMIEAPMIDPSAENNFRSQPSRRGTWLRQKDDWGRVNALDIDGEARRQQSTSEEKLSLQDLYPPRAGEERDSDQRDDGGRANTVDIGGKKLGAGPHPPPPTRNGTPAKGRWG